MTFNGSNSLTVGGLNSNSGTCSTIAGGFSNNIGSVAKSFIGAGECNSVQSNCSIIGAGLCNTIASGYTNYSTIVSGFRNCMTGYSTGGFIGAGFTNEVYGRNSVVVGGVLNCANGYGCDFIGSGRSNKITGYGGNVIVGGGSNCNNGYSQNSIVGGCSNCIKDNYGHYHFIGGGHKNYIDSCYSSGNSILGGTCNCICNAGISDKICYTTIIGGFKNTASVSSANGYTSCPTKGFIGGGECNRITNPFDFIVAGQCNKISINKEVQDSKGYNFIVGNKNTIDVGYKINMIIGHNSSMYNSGAYGGEHSIIGGRDHCITGNYGSGANIIGGSSNNINSGYGNGSSIVTGRNNCIGSYTSYSVIIGGQNNTICNNGYCHTILGGNNNTLSAYNSRSTIIGGCNNTNNHSCSVMLGLAGRLSCTNSTTHVNCLNIQSTCGGTTGAKQVSILPGITSNGSVVTDMCEMCVAYNATQIQGVLGNGPNCVIITAPGANKTLIIYEAIFQIQTSGTNTTQGFNGAFQVVSPSYNCNNTSINNTVAALIPSNVLQASVRNGQTYTTYQRDAPTDGRIYSTNQCVRFGWSTSNPYPSGFPSEIVCLRTRLRYKIYCDTAF